MKVKGLDGRVHNWNLNGHIPLGSKEAGSSYHKACRLLLASLFPVDRRLEEVLLPGTKSLRADFVLPNRRLMLECHGPQHYKFTPFFHKNKLDFLKACQRDQQKKEWAELNDFVYVELPYDRDETDWTRRILDASRGRSSADD